MEHHPKTVPQNSYQFAALWPAAGQSYSPTTPLFVSPLICPLGLTPLQGQDPAGRVGHHGQATGRRKESCNTHLARNQWGQISVSKEQVQFRIANRDLTEEHHTQNHF